MTPLIRRIEPESLAPVLNPIFHAAFGHGISERLIDWKYADGRGESWIATAADGQPQVHCGLLYRDILLAGEPVRAAQLVDLAAVPKKSGLTRTDSPYAHLMRHLLHTGTDRRPRFAFGFPSGRAMRLGEHLGVFRSVDQLYDLDFPAAAAPRFGLRCQELPALPETAVTDRLWREMAQQLTAAAVGVRDRAYLTWRFARHPEHRYRFLTLHGWLTRKAHGLAILRPADDGLCQLIDLLAPPDVFPEIFPALAAWIADAGFTTLRFSTPHTPSRRFASLAARCTPTEIRIMANPQLPDEVLAQLQGVWWLTSGDTDYR